MSALTDRLRSEASQTLEKWGASPGFVAAKDRFEALPSRVQKLVIFSGVAVVALSVLSIPWGWYQTSREAEAEFTRKRQVIEDLLQVQGSLSGRAPLPISPTLESVRAQAEEALRTVKALPEQIRGISASSEKLTGIAGVSTRGAWEVQVEKLNLRQVVDFGFQLSQNNPLVRVQDLELTASSGMPSGYFDAKMLVAVLELPLASLTPAPNSGGVPPPGGAQPPSPSQDLK